MKIDVTTLSGGKSDAIELNDEIFGLEPRSDVLHRVVRWQLAKRQQGTHKVKGRSEIARTGKKFGRQKGGGGARHGSRRANIFVGGGQVFGPTPRSHGHELPKKFRKLGLRHALSAKAKAGELIVLDKAEIDGKTATLKAALKTFGEGSFLFIDGSEVHEGFARAAKNLPGVDVLPSQGANVYDILRRDRLILTADGVKALEERLK